MLNSLNSQFGKADSGERKVVRSGRFLVSGNWIGGSSGNKVGWVRLRAAAPTRYCST